MGLTYFITAFGILYVIAGVIFFMRPEYVRAVIEFFMVGKRAYIAGAVRIVIGALLIYAAQKALIPWIPRIIGIVAVIGGIIIYALGIQRMNVWMEWLKALTDNRFRIFAVLAEVVGILLVFSA